MANTLTCVLLMFWFCGSALGARTKIFTSDHTSQSVPVSGDGVCKAMVEIHGYFCEEHTVTTRDGYILSMQRIPMGRSGNKTGDRPPVLLQHGVLMDGITWLLTSPEKALAFILADNSFDVWIANTRGTKYSRGHTSLSTDDMVYWNWTWDQLVENELPAMFEYVHDQTSQKLHYVGHSQGTLIALASFSQEKLLNMLRSAALLSPVAYLGQVSSPIVRKAAENYVAENFYEAGIIEFDPVGAVSDFLKSICKKQEFNCYDYMDSFTGKNCCLNSTTIAVFLEHEPQPTSTKNMIHLSQMTREGTLAKYDYGDKNMEHYGQAKPPTYNMRSIPKDLPLFLTHGGQDTLSDVDDVKVLLESLKDHDKDKLVVQYLEDYAHADFVMAMNAKQVVYEPLMAFFKLY